MGRKEKRQENRKKIKNIEKSVPEEGSELERLVKIFFGVVGALLIFYLIFAFFHGELFKKKEKTVETIQDVEIMAGTVFNKAEDEYLVILYDFNGDNAKLCSGIYNVYSSLDSKTVKLFKVNLGSGLNKNYLAANESEVNTNNAETLKVLDATLLRVKDGKVTEVISGRDKLIEYEDTLLK